MAATSHLRGYNIYFDFDELIWRYTDTDEPTISNKRSCGHCKKGDTKEGYDNCLGTLPDVMNACCGHGIDDEAYVQFWNNDIIRGKRVVKWIKTRTPDEWICPAHGYKKR